MINALILINLLAALALGCQEGRERDAGDQPPPEEVDLSGKPDASDEGETGESGERRGEIVDGVKQLGKADLSVLPLSADADQDNIPNESILGSDRIDNCPDVFNPTQDDADGDGRGDACDTDQAP